MPRGSIRRRGLTWTAVLDAGRDPTTRKRRQISRGGFKTKKEAQRWLTSALGQVDQGSYVAPTRELVGEYLLEWLAAIRSSLRPSTWESYERLCRRHLIPRIGHVYLHQLGPGHLSTLYSDLHADGRLDGAGGLSARSVHYLHVILSKALADAVAEGRLPRNVAGLKTVRERLPKRTGHDMTTWTAAQLTSFLRGLAGDQLEVPILLGATTGMRRGEVLGLRWSDVDLDAGRLAVRQTLSAPRNPDTGQHVPIFGEPKTRRGKRSVPLPAQTVAACAPTARRRRPSGSPSAPTTPTTAWCSPSRTAARSTPTGSASASSTGSSGPGYHRSASTTCATPTPPSRCRPASTPRWCPRSSGTPTSASPSTPTATPSRASRRAPPRPSRPSCSAPDTCREQTVSIRPTSPRY
jgi:integrase